MSHYAFFFDQTRCTGCKTCVIACKDKYDLGVGVSPRKVYECTGGETTCDEDGCFASTCFSYYLSLACNHCSDPVCVQVCPTMAMGKDADTGLVSIDARRCIGCGYCHLSCPYNAPKVDRSKGRSVKCDGCKDRVAAGEKPSCVLACPSRALAFGTIEGMALLGERASISPLPEPSDTTPNLFIKPSRDARPTGSLEVVVSNPLEIR